LIIDQKAFTFLLQDEKSKLIGPKSERNSKTQNTDNFWKSDDQIKEESKKAKEIFNENDFDFTNNSRQPKIDSKKSSGIDVKSYASTPVNVNQNDIFFLQNAPKNTNLIDFNNVDQNITPKKVQSKKEFCFDDKFNNNKEESMESIFNNMNFVQPVKYPTSNISQVSEAIFKNKGSIINTNTQEIDMSNELKQKLKSSNLVDLDNLLDNTKLKFEIKIKKNAIPLNQPNNIIQDNTKFGQNSSISK